MPILTLPDHWDAQQALYVYEFITEIQDAIWQHYGPQLTEALRLEQCPEGEQGTDDMEGEIDF